MTSLNTRRTLSSTRESMTHKFSINGHEGYLTLGLFDDGSVGEIFIKMSKEGSTLSGLIQGFCRAFSLCLQFGLPAAERTTQEIAQLLPMSAVPKSWHDRLLTGLTQADVVKFAKGQLPDASHASTLDAYLDFVLDTKAEDHEEE